MIRFFALFATLFISTSFALVETGTSKKQVPTDAHVDHPDHVPHNHGGKDPIKKVTQDELIFPRKKKKKLGLVMA